MVVRRARVTCSIIPSAWHPTWWKSKTLYTLRTSSAACCWLSEFTLVMMVKGNNKPANILTMFCNKETKKSFVFSISPQISNWQAYLHYHTHSKLCVSGCGWEVIYFSCVFSINYHAKRWVELTVFFFPVIFSCQGGSPPWVSPPGPDRYARSAPPASPWPTNHVGYSQKEWVHTTSLTRTGYLQCMPEKLLTSRFGFYRFLCSPPVRWAALWALIHPLLCTKRRIHHTWHQLV